jgi:hypothetical protein
LNKKYLIKERYARSSSRHFFDLFVCQCGQILRRRVKAKTIFCTSCREIPTKFDAMKAINKIYNNYQISAWERQLSFEISLQEFSELVLSSCTYCGGDFSNTLKRPYGEFKYNGVDRIDSSIGYKISNLATACKHCNFAKNNRSTQEFISWAQRVVEHTKKIGLK